MSRKKKYRNGGGRVPKASYAAVQYEFRAVPERTKPTLNVIRLIGYRSPEKGRST